MPGTAVHSPDWEVCPAVPATLLPQIAAHCSGDERLAWNAPDAGQIAHYEHDPRTRTFLALRKRGHEWCGGAFVVDAELRAAQGLQRVATVESIFLRPGDAGGLAVLFEEAGHCHSHSIGLISAPNVSAFDEASLRKAHIRKVGTGFQGYASGISPMATATNLEII
jgi:hypothetical protein